MNKKECMLGDINKSMIKAKKNYEDINICVVNYFW